MGISQNDCGFQAMVFVWKATVVLCLLYTAEGEGPPVKDVIKGTAVPTAEALMGTVVMPVFPSSFPLEEFTDYGVHSQFMPSAPSRPRPDYSESRLGQSYNNQNDKSRIDSGSIMAGSVPVNTYHNPTTGLAQYQNSPHRRTDLLFRDSNPTWGSSWGNGGVGEGVLRSKSDYSSGNSHGNLRRPSIDRFDIYGYSDFAFNYEDREEKPEDGTLQAALYTLWEH
ncbi:hypothetical protein SK128_011635, partial [Halocaridina rubra]